MTGRGDPMRIILFAVLFLFVSAGPAMADSEAEKKEILSACSAKWKTDYEYEMVKFCAGGQWKAKESLAALGGSL